MSTTSLPDRPDALAALVFVAVFLVLGLTARFPADLADHPASAPSGFRAAGYQAAAARTQDALLRVESAIYEPFPGEPTLKIQPADVNVARACLHGLCALLAFLFLRALLPKQDRAAACGALLFGLHPLQLQAAASGLSLGELVGGFCTLLCLWQYFEQARDGVVRARHLAISSAAFALALLLRPEAAAIPFAALVLDLGVMKRSLRQALPALAAWALFAIAALAWDSRVAASGWPQPLAALAALGSDTCGYFFPWSRAREQWSQAFSLVPLAVAASLVVARRRRWIAAAVSSAMLFAIFALALPAGAAGAVYLASLGPALALTCLLEAAFQQ